MQIAFIYSIDITCKSFISFSTYFKWTFVGNGLWFNDTVYCKMGRFPFWSLNLINNYIFNILSDKNVDLGNQNFSKDNLHCKIRAVITGIKILQETRWCNRRSKNGSFILPFLFWENVSFVFVLNFLLIQGEMFNEL